MHDPGIVFDILVWSILHDHSSLSQCLKRHDVGKTIKTHLPDKHKEVVCLPFPNGGFIIALPTLVHFPLIDGDIVIGNTCMQNGFYHWIFMKSNGNR